MYRLEIIDRMIKAILSNECNHTKINEFNTGSHCPDCGKIINISWITIRCQYCKKLRMAKISKDNRIIPQNKYCNSCASEKWFSIRSEKINFSERKYAIPVKEIIEEVDISGKSKTEVWVEQSDKSEIKRSSNVIKASKKFKA